MHSHQKKIQENFDAPGFNPMALGGRDANDFKPFPGYTGNLTLGGRDAYRNLPMFIRQMSTGGKIGLAAGVILLIIAIVLIVMYFMKGKGEVAPVQQVYEFF